MTRLPGHPIRVLLADDHPVYLEGLQMLLDTVTGIEVVGTAVSGRELVELAASVVADVAVVDLDMPDPEATADSGDCGGAAAAARLRAGGGPEVLVLTMHADQASVVRALRAGAKGYVLKSSPAAVIAQAIEAVANGDTWLTGVVGEHVRAAATHPAVAVPGLSGRESEVLALVARGLPNPAVARELHLSPKTVQNHVSAIAAKLGTRSRAELVAWARDAGLGDR